MAIPQWLGNQPMWLDGMHISPNSSPNIIYIHISQYLYIYICVYDPIYIYCIPKIHCCIKYRYGPYGCVWKYGIPNSNGFIILFPSFTDRPFSGDSPSSDRPIDTSSSANHLWHQEYIPYVIYQVIIRIYPVRALKLRQKKTPLFLVETFFVETIIFQPNYLAGSRIP